MIWQEHMELEKRYRELTDLLVFLTMTLSSNFYSVVYILYLISSALISGKTIICFQYYKQTQLEAMATEKAAAEFQLEKEVKRLQEAQVCTFCF